MLKAVISYFGNNELDEDDWRETGGREIII